MAKLRKERSAEAARARRNKENGEYDNIKKLLPIDESKFTEHRTFFVLNIFFCSKCSKIRPGLTSVDGLFDVRRAVRTFDV